MTKLSKNFSLEELTKSNVAIRYGIDNTPSETEIACLTLLAVNILQPIRDHFGIPFIPNSGFRSKALNDKLNGSPTSQHMKGQAADIEIPGIDNAELANWIANRLIFDQVILESYTQGIPSSGWVHVSYVYGNNRQNCLTINTPYTGWMQLDGTKRKLTKLDSPANTDNMTEEENVEMSLEVMYDELSTEMEFIKNEYVTLMQEYMRLKDTMENLTRAVAELSIKINNLQHK